MSEFEQIYQDIDTLPEEAKIILLDFIQLLKKCYSKSETESNQEGKSTYEKFEEIGLIGFCSVEEDLSTNYKEVLADTLASKYDNS
ncbi:hypothetical protein Xen7305DRAFT_00006980 [Xenococcus sp. PCC 7305]|uniref:hypothetical protein n=1 Tax=Xenococcus sp. PCC 7305 TaxID=102125 RepID=UPI0002ACAED6|nr:hypothetical protein [Xenococcus sp. PCC 7305]ELS00997.1 hypothetical protein Xen7305DRAFT_00006980 [Xenococcus sp. PCC 7305]